MAANPGRFIQFGVKDTNSGAKNSLSKLLQEKKFDYNITKYPLDLGAAGQGRSHYIVFHILEQRKSQYRTSQVTGEGSTIANVTETQRSGEREYVRAIGQAGDVVVDLANKGIAFVNDVTNSFADTNSSTESEGGSILNNATAFLSGAGGTVASKFPQVIQDATRPEFLRTVTKTSETIALYMPDTLNFIQQQGYADLELGNNLLTALFAGGKGVADSIRAFNQNGGGNFKALGESIGENLSPFIINSLGDKLGNLGKAIAVAGQGMVTNPLIEVLYTSPGLRTFRFDFMFYPESQKEALAVQKIIQLFQFHQAPEIAPGTGGYFLVPPSEFDIEFFYNGYENVNLPSISTCVLSSLDVDYAPNGWTAYEITGENPKMGGSGMPVATKLSLEFKETSIVTKASRQFDKAPKPPSQTFPVQNR
jgi:hypothetical protein